MLLGVIADDLTGATDVALMISRQGMNTVQVIGVPSRADFGDVDAVVVALKSRTIPAREAIALSLAAARALRSAGAEQLLFKYCSTFDSTEEGNIGPVTEALLDLVGSDLTIACPAFPAAGRSIYLGHLFVGDVLLSDSPMKDHPLTPMRDANLVRVLQRQVKGRVGLIPLALVERGAAAIATGSRPPGPKASASSSSTRSATSTCARLAPPAPTCRSSPAGPASRWAFPIISAPRPSWPRAPRR